MQDDHIRSVSYPSLLDFVMDPRIYLTLHDAHYAHVHYSIAILYVITLVDVLANRLDTIDHHRCNNLPNSSGD